jgi:hypothetical protein
MTDTKRLNTILGIFAVLILLFSFSAFAYTLIPQGDASLVIVNDIEYEWNVILSDFDKSDFTTDDGVQQGVLVSTIILDTGLENPESYDYKLIGIDGYQKDVTWDDVQNGFFVEEDHIIILPHMTRSFWVKDLVSIEVVV